MNALFSMVCPSCGAHDQIDIEATVWIRVTPDGTDADASEDGDHTFTPDSRAKCCACHHRGTVENFDPN